MKLDDVLKEAMSRDADQERIANILRDIWEDQYTYFLEDAAGLAYELADRFPNEKKAKKAQDFFSEFFKSYEDCRVPLDEANYFRKYEDELFRNADELESFEGTVKALKTLKTVVEKFADDGLVFCNYMDIEDREYQNDTFQYGKPFDPYDEYGVSRKDF